MHIPVKKLIDNFYAIASRQVYFDNNATTPLDPEVRAYMQRVQNKIYGNPSSMHMAGMNSREVIENARREVAQIINAFPDEIIFTSGGTEANNTIIKGVAAIKPGAHFITSAVEHQSVLSVFKSLGMKGFEVSYIGVGKDGKVDLDQLKNSIRKNTCLISIMHVNNETGAINEINEIAGLAKAKKVLFHSDIVQSFGKLKIDVKKLPVDYLSFSAHKIYGPKGCGAMYIRKDSPFNPLLQGGHQEREFRPGTESLYCIAGFGKACEKLREMDTGIYLEDMSRIRDIILTGIRKIFPLVKLNGDI